jgi:hypothetical protein
MQPVRLNMAPTTGEESPRAPKYNAAERAAALDMNRWLGVGIGEPPYDPEAKVKPATRAKPKRKRKRVVKANRVAPAKEPKTVMDPVAVGLVRQAAEDRAATRLAPVLQALAVAKERKLQELKAEQVLLERDDVVWHQLVVSFSTWGREKGWDGLVGDKKNYARVTFEAISEYAPHQRVEEVERTMRVAQVRFARIKAEYLVHNHSLFARLGGPKAVRDLLLAAPGKPGKMAFLMQFSGIGPKYARNILMDLYHPEFRESIAIDSRVQGITAQLGLRFGSYEAEEAFYVAVGHRVDLNGWTVDRILFNFRKEVRDGLAAR